ncbi:hypothetical protein Cgig2_031268 [Carnegiea gigantea]|uniref:Uncharacterized protein n=1 Tax=Carnegiea gigantea TaxID=171969 RepID=A0A9Q1QME9_9CARY|nr:hypothetical protein Cgig2_031268 [Carnegiea gigantea]
MEENTNASLKRVREEEETEIEEEEDLKRQKSYKDIINLLEEDEDDPNEDLSSIISTLLDELSSGGPDPEKPGALGSVSSSGSEEEREGEGEGEGGKVMRHLLEASDDELGIPSTDGLDSSVGGSYVDGGGWSLPVGESLWEFEDHEAANYYNLLQSEIFIINSIPTAINLNWMAFEEFVMVLLSRSQVNELLLDFVGPKIPPGVIR